MKSTMKKLLCMALAIMLLVSAVPVFAAADNVSCTVDIYIDDVKQDAISGLWNVSSDATLISLLQSKITNCDDYTILTYKDNAGASGSEAVGEATYVQFRLATKSYKVSLSVDGTMYYKNLPTTSTYVIGNDILTLFGATIPAGKEVAGWKNEGQSVKPANGMDVNTPFVCYLRDAQNTATGTITAKFSVDGANEVTMKFSANAKTVSELIALGGYSAYDFNKAGLGGSGNKRDVNSLSATINAGETVYIKMKTKTTSDGSTGSGGSTNTPSTSSWINFAVKVNSSSNVVYDNGKNLANGSSATINNLIKNLYDSNWASKYTFDYAWSSAKQAKITDVDATVYAGDTVTVMLKSKSPADQKYDFGTGKTVNVVCNGTVIMTRTVKNQAEFETLKSDAIAKIKSLGYQFKGWK